MENTSTLCTRIPDKTLSLITKRTYKLENERVCVPADQQLEIYHEPVFDEKGAIVHDTDAVIYKLATDLVVKAKAWSPFGRSLSILEVSIKVGRYGKRGLVFGDRKCFLKNGTIRFSEPKHFVSIPINYANAYGGCDESSRSKLDDMGLDALQEYLSFNISNANLCAYRRNTIGKGYIIGGDERIDGLNLPNIEDPDDLLTSERLPVRDPKKWYLQPVPLGFDWYDYDWFPRSAYFGLTWGDRDDVPGPEDPPIREIELGYVPNDMFKGKTLQESISEKVLNGASPGLILPFLKGNESISLTHMDPDFPTFTFHLPGDVPILELKPVGENWCELEPRLYSIIVEKEINIVSLVWGGFTKTKYPHGPDQIKNVEYKVRW